MMRAHSGGFTLVEVVVVVGLFVLMMSGLASLFLSFNSLYGYQQALMATAGSANAIASDIATYAAPARAVVATYTFTDGPHASSASELVLELPSIDASGNIVPGSYDYAAFYSSGGSAYESVQAAVSSARVSRVRQLSQTLDALTFSYDAVDPTQAHQVTADISTRATYNDTPVTAHLERVIDLRNHE